MRAAPLEAGLPDIRHSAVAVTYDRRDFMRPKGRNKATNPQGGGPRPPGTRLPKYDPTATPIWEGADELAAEVPDAEWRKVPPDLARNLHHYLHGGPKDDPE